MKCKTLQNDYLKKCKPDGSRFSDLLKVRRRQVDRCSVNDFSLSPPTQNRKRISIAQSSLTFFPLLSLFLSLGVSRSPSFFDCYDCCAFLHRSACRRGGLLHVNVLKYATWTEALSTVLITASMCLNKSDPEQPVSRDQSLLPVDKRNGLSPTKPMRFLAHLQ